MRIDQKLILGFVGIVVLVGFIGYAAVNRYAANIIYGAAGSALLLIVGLGFFVARGITRLNSEIAAYKKGEKEFAKAKETLEQQAWGIKKTDDAIKALYKDLEKEKARADKASKAKSDFLGNMSHELRTPLNAIIGFSEALSDELFGSLNDKQKEYAGIVVTGGKHLLSLINDVLDIAKIEAGKMDLNLSIFDVQESIMSSVFLIEEKTMKRDIKVGKNIKGDLGNIKADERKIKQILFNLLSNAEKFTPNGGSIGIEAEKTEDNELLISVWDTGIGIEEKDIGRVFEEFKQIDNSLTREYSGTGLGIPITKRFVELHGGKLWLESEGKGKGSHFYFTLPVNSFGEEEV